MVNVTCVCKKSGFRWTVALDENSHMPSCPIHRRKTCIAILTGSNIKGVIDKNGRVKPWLK
jgi:hypothetical protein